MKILLIEDNPGDVILTSEALKEILKSKFVLDTAADGAIALDVIDDVKAGNHHKPDLVLLDLNLPKVNGQEVLKYIKSDPETSKIPVVVLSTSARYEDVEESRRLNAFGYVTKPVNYHDFIREMREVIGRVSEMIRMRRPLIL